jgi:sugar lactone lactonase YvrE
MMAPSGNFARIFCVALATLAPWVHVEATPDHEAKTADSKPCRTDSYGDPLPDGVLFRLGSVRWRHADDVHQIAFTVDGANIVSCGANGWVHTWDAASGKRRRHFRAGRAIDPTALDDSPAVLSSDGRLLATVMPSKDGKSDKVILWQTAAGKAFREVKGDGLFSQLSSGSLAFSADGKTLATGSSKGVLRLFDTDTGRERRLLRWDEWEIDRLAFSADGKRLAAVSLAAGVALWNVADGVCLRTFSAPKDEHMTAVSFAPDGKTLATGTGQGTLQI